MTKEELLKPRVKVIAEYPNNQDFPLGKIIDFEPYNVSYWEHSVEDCQGKRTWLDTWFDQYPHLFKRLEWWEERSFLELPRYIKQYEDVFEVAEWHVNLAPKCSVIINDIKRDQFVWDGRHDTCPICGDFLPATREDYDAYISSKQ